MVLGCFGLPFLLSLGIIRNTLAKKLYKVNFKRHTLGRSLFWAYISSLGTVYFNYTITGVGIYYYNLHTMTHPRISTLGKIFVEASYQSLIAMALALPAILLFGTWIGWDSFKKMKQQVAYQR